MTDNEVILNALKGEINPSYGICALVDVEIILLSEADERRISRLFKQVMVEQAKRLGFYSGSSIYPIASTNGDDSGYIYHNYISLWDENDEYCRRRIALHKAMIQVFEERVEYEELEQQNMDNLEGNY